MFGNQPPHPPAFGKDIPKKNGYFFGSFPNNLLLGWGSCKKEAFYLLLKKTPDHIDDKIFMQYLLKKPRVEEVKVIAMISSLLR